MRNARERDTRERRDRAAQERFALQQVAHQISKFVSEFRRTSSQWNFVENLRRLSRAGEVTFIFPPLPPLWHAKVNSLARRITEQAAQIKSIEEDPKLRARDTPGQITSALEAQYKKLDTAIKATIDEFEIVLHELNLATEDRDKVWVN